MKTLPDGAYPVMLTPFRTDGAVDEEVLDRYTDWLLTHGSAGLFPVALSGEMYELDESERLSVARRVVERTAGRAPVLASVVEFGDAEAVASASARMAATGVDVVVLIASVLLAETEGEDVLREKVTTALGANPGVVFGIYECPVPYHRILTTDTVQWLAQTGRFVFFKETSHDVKLMADRVRVSKGTPLKVFNAGIETLVESLAVGVSGLSGWVVNVYPDLVRRIVEGGGGGAFQGLQDELDYVERTMGPTYPASGKALVELRQPMGFSTDARWHPTDIDHHLLEQLQSRASRFTQDTLHV